MKNIIIATGGTGGHLYPGIALARELKKRGNAVSFIVKENDLGKDIIKNEGFELNEIAVIGMPRVISFKLIKFFVLLFKAFFATGRIFSEKKPDVVYGMGGYISFTSIVTGKINKIKTIIHEQNAIPGLANKYLSRIADITAVSFEEAVEFFPKEKTVLTGNPVRQELFNQNPENAYKKFNLSKDRFTVFVFGGSQGAKKLNQLVMNAAELLNEDIEKVQFLHIIGKEDTEYAKNYYSERNIKACVLNYLDTIGEAYSIADLIICRSGATTVAELQILNKPSILVPFPFATANHQEFNAAVLVNSLQGIMLKEDALEPKLITHAIKFRLKSFPAFTKPKPNIPAKWPQEKLADLIK